jgi:hypothetical protein
MQALVCFGHKPKVRVATKLVEDDDKVFNSSLSFAMQEKKVENDDEVHSFFALVSSKDQKMITNIALIIVFYLSFVRRLGGDVERNGHNHLLCKGT